MERNGWILNFISNFPKKQKNLHYFRKFQSEIKFIVVYTQDLNLAQMRGLLYITKSLESY